MDACCIMAAKRMAALVDRTAIRTSKPVRQTGVASGRSGRNKHAFYWLPDHKVWRCAGCGTIKRKTKSGIDSVSCKALQDQGALVHVSHSVVRCMEEVANGVVDGVPVLLCRRCGCHGSLKLIHLRRVCKGPCVRGRAMSNSFCGKHVHPDRKTRTVGVVNVQ